MRVHARFAAATLAAVLTGCAGGEPRLEVDAAQAAEPVSGASQIVVDIANVGDGDDELVSAETDAAVAVELHRTTVDDGRATMEQLQTVELPAGATTAFRPGGLHLMMVAPDETLAEGGTFELELTFERSDPITVDVEVVELLDLAESSFEDP